MKTFEDAEKLFLSHSIKGTALCLTARAYLHIEMKDDIKLAIELYKQALKKYQSCNHIPG